MWTPLVSERSSPSGRHLSPLRLDILSSAFANQLGSGRFRDSTNNSRARHGLQLRKQPVMRDRAALGLRGSWPFVIKHYLYSPGLRFSHWSRRPRGWGGTHMDPSGRWMVVGLKLSLELFFLKASQYLFNQCIQRTSLVPGSGLGTEGAGNLGTARGCLHSLPPRKGEIRQKASSGNTGRPRVGS